MNVPLKIFSNFIYATTILFFVGCKNTQINSTSKTQKTTNLRGVNPFEPDHNFPEKEINGYQLVFNDEFNHEGPMKSEY